MLTRRSRLLFLAPYFPPLHVVACVRTWNIAKYLARSDWDVTVVTPHPSVWRHTDNLEETVNVIEKEGIQTILTDHQWRCLAPDFLNCWNQGLGWATGGVCRNIARHLGIDSGVGWIKAAERACEMLTAEDVDAILASGPPYTTFKLAKHLSDKLGRPYVLDYRDPWTGFPHATSSTRRAVAREESNLLAGCAAAIITSRSWRLAMEQRFGYGPKLQVITNGFDPDDLINIKPYDFGHFAIIYAGIFYPPKRIITPIMAALKRLKAMGHTPPEWYFHYYGEGGDESHVREEAIKFGVMDRVVLHGRVPRSEVLSALRGAGVAVVITSVFERATIEDRGIVTGKVFEALGLGTPVLLLAPSGSDAEKIAMSTGVARSYRGHDTNGIVSFLKDVMQGESCKPTQLEAYTWGNLSKRFDTILRGAVENSVCRNSEEWY
ncbi:MAG: glycosyltransferase [Candidatus Tectomicrobia bacterium]|nr:glycosyltransferase [Candidatus Tectomicrobia bacterium]